MARKLKNRLLYKRTGYVDSYGESGRKRTKTFKRRSFGLKSLSFQSISSFLMTLPGLMVTFYVLYNFEGVKFWIKNLWFGFNVGNLSKTKADLLYSAMNYMGHSYNDIQDILSNVNENQYLSIVKSFGLKPYDTTWGYNTSDGIIGTTKDYNLNQWLQEELSDYEKVKLRLVVPYIKNYGI